MRTEIHSPARYRFGTFEVIPDSLELRKCGVRLKLREQPFRLLVIMLERPGQLVTREELRRLLWSEDTFVDFDKGLNTAINKLREVLSDSAAQRRFIETIPRHGYRFIAEVEKRGSATESALLSVSENVATRNAAIQSPLDRATAVVAYRRRFAWLWTVVVADICLIAVLLATFRYNQPLPTPLLGNAIQLTNDGVPKNELVTDGVRVFYSSPMNRDLSNWRTFEVSLGGGEPRPLSLVPEAMSPFAVSADRSALMLGSSALRQSNDGTELPPERLWSQPLAGGPPRALALRACDASWSPDGSEIVFATGQHIGLARPDGTAIRMLADVPDAPSGLRWSPGGDRIRFTLHYGIAHKDAAIWELSPKDGKAHPLFPHFKNEQADGEWTPDGRFYLFSQTNNGISQI
jgi:DNA-binding winged helix-turn-helix (wHTH) protein